MPTKVGIHDFLTGDSKVVDGARSHAMTRVANCYVNAYGGLRPP
jgi:hypothetical protein